MSVDEASLPKEAQTSTKMTSASAAFSVTEADAEPKPQVYLKLGPTDILVGRGAPANVNPGNVGHRELVKQRKGDYAATKNRQTKNQIAMDIVQHIEGLGGKFLRKIELAEAEELGLAEGTSGWLEVPKEKAIRKTKQALRDKDLTAQIDEDASSHSDGASTIDRVPSLLDQSRDWDSLPRLSDLFGHQEISMIQGHEVTQIAQRTGLPLSSNGIHCDQLRNIGERGYQNLGPLMASLFLAKTQSLLHPAQVDVGRVHPMSGMFPALAQPQASLNIISALAQREVLLRNPTLPGASHYERLLTNQTPLSVVSAHEQVNAAASSLLSSTNTASAMQLTKAELEITLATHKRYARDEQLAVSKAELPLLRVVACHGLPVWRSDLKGVFELQSSETSRNTFLWRDFASKCKRFVGEEQMHAPSNELSMSDCQSLQALAQRVIMLLEKLFTASSISESAASGNKSDLCILLWFRAELNRWASHLDISDDIRHCPVAFITQDLDDSRLRTETYVSLVGGLTMEACVSIVTQAAHMTRLRSIDSKIPTGGLGEKLCQVYLINPSHTKRMLTASRQRQDVVDLDTILLEGILEIGFSGHLLERFLPNISKSDAQTHVEHLIASLHSLQADEDRHSILAIQKKRIMESLQRAGPDSSGDLLPQSLKKQKNSP